VAAAARDAKIPVAPASRCGRKDGGHPPEETAMSHPRDHLVCWLRDAHAMERQSEQMLRAQATRLERDPKLAGALGEHLEQTLAQRELLEECLRRLDAEPSALKDAAGRLDAGAQSLATLAVADEPVKAAIACLAFEQMEVATYTVLFAAAHQAGDIQCQRMFDRLLHEEQAMADWLRGSLPGLVQAYLARDAAADREVTAQSMAPGAAQPPRRPADSSTPPPDGERPRPHG